MKAGLATVVLAAGAAAVALVTGLFALLRGPHSLSDRTNWHNPEQAEVIA
jgi:hypothetical protein